MRRIVIALLSLLAVACTGVHYRSPVIAQKVTVQQKVAVLPFTMLLGGKQPEGLTPEQILQIEEYESLAFQRSLYLAMLDRADAGRTHRIHAEIQPVEETNRILSDNGISLRESWELAPEALAEMLGVDAVIRTEVQKTRYLSDLASYGIDLGAEILHEATEGKFGWLIPPGLSKTHDIFADASMLDGENGDLLWKVAVEREAAWHRPANAVIAALTRKLARKFPYRS